MGHPPELPCPVRPGDRVAHYEILAELGRGGMGVVYSARDLTLGRRVALKCPLPGEDHDDRLHKRLLREARAASQLSHPHIVPVYEVLEHDGVPWLAMELVEGTTLRGQLASGRPLAVKDVLEYADGLASALESAHARNVLHRDINPNNVMVTVDGRAVLTDFGLARMLAISESSTTQSRDSDLSGPGRVVGTLRYMSPEQALGKPLDARSDLFSLGAVIYEMCTGEAAFPERGAEVLDAVLHRPPVPISRLNYDVPEELERIVRKCLAKDPGDRYQTARELGVDLRTLRRRLDHKEYVERAVTRSPPSPWRSLPVRVGAMTGAMVAVVLASVHYWAPTRGAPAPPTFPYSARALAFVPFDNASDRSEWNYVAQGITADVAREVQKAGVVVKARESADPLRDLTDAEIGRRLDVDRVGRGRITRDGDNLLLEAHVTQASTGAEVWQRTYRQPLDRLRDLYVAVATDITANMLGAPPSLAPARSSHRPPFDAYQAYHEGRLLWGQRTKESLERSLSAFDRAIALDDKYAEPWAGKADAYIALAVPTFGGIPPKDARRRAEDAARQALELDPKLAEGMASLGFISFFFDWDWVQAETRFKEAIQLNPQYATAHHWYANHLNALGRQEEAMREIHIAFEIEPLSLVIRRDFGWHYFFQRKYGAAIDQLTETLRIDPNFAAARSLLGRALIEAGRGEEGLVELRKAAQGTPTAAVQSFIAYGEAATGQREEADRALRHVIALSDREYVPPFYVALVYARLGRKVEALEWLERGYERRDPTMVNLFIDPRLDGLRDEPRFAELVQKMNFPVEAARRSAQR
jgi:tetratricopeptide (TPR) repeat protein/predicted Ser/Thr protein kinase